MFFLFYVPFDTNEISAALVATSRMINQSVRLSTLWPHAVFAFGENVEFEQNVIR